MPGTASKAFSPALKEYQIRVLLIDDQAMVGETVRRMLAPEADIVFEYCQDPTQAVPTAVEWSPTVILQDLVMPEVDGLDLVHFFRAHPKLADIPLIVLSSKEEAVTKAEAFAVGANDYLVKLPHRVELVARIRYHSKGYINLLQRNEAYRALLESQEKLASEVARAAEYVTSLLPQPITQGVVTTAWRYVPSATLGGDSFGYHWIDDDHFAFYLLDVCGHGVGSALLSVSALNVLRSQSLPHVDFREPAAVLGGMNASFQMEKQNDLYFTMWYGVYDRQTRRLKYSCAGHPPALLFIGCEPPTQLFTQNFFIGGFLGGPFHADEILVPSHSRLYLFSDGVYEVDSPDGSMWTLEGLQGFLQSSAAVSGQEIDALWKKLQEMHGSDVLEDDFSLLRVDFQ
ncbi:MAG: SpoIIE family protein phosphatase [Terriglobia bacterium]|jgi:sigma-B regulation protein RsbU (phosphoserine phosphatase)